MFLIYGGNGFVGGLFIEELKRRQMPFVLGAVRTDDVNGLYRELNKIKPDFVVSFVGRTHGPDCPTIDYIEPYAAENATEARRKVQMNVRDNLFSPVLLALLCQQHGIHFTQVGTGCIYSGYRKPYGDAEKPDFFGSSYSIVKGYTDQLLVHLPVLHLRIRMPITDDENPRDFITKIQNYERIIDLPNSMTVMSDFVPLWVDMITNRLSGPFNCVNPGHLTHTEILQMVRTYVDPEQKINVMTTEEQDAILASGRSNNLLDTAKIVATAKSLGHVLPSLRKSVESILIHRGTRQ